MLSSRPRQSMVHVTICGISSALRLLFPPLEPSLVFAKPATKPYSLLAFVASAAPRRRRSLPHREALGISREHGTTPEGKGNREKGPPMEETKSTSAPAYGFNKRRADGKDEQDKPKKALHLKQRMLNPTNTIAYVQILGTGMDTQDTSPSVLLFFDKQRFIFNAGEGLQRYCSDHKIRLSKIDHIFLSRVCSETTSGLPGLLLTLAGIGEEGLSVNVWGPSDLNLLVDAMKAFIPHAAMVHTRSFGPSNDATSVPNHRRLAEPFVLVDNEVVKIAAIILHINCSKDSQAKSGNMSVIYICELPQLMGKFDPKKAAALGLRPGPKYRELQSGNSVKSDSLDITVHPCDVIGPPVPGPIFLLVDCPTDSHLEQLVSMKSLNEYYSDGEIHQPKRAKYVNCIIHLSPVSVVQIPSYQKWMKKFGSAKHIIAGHQLKNVEIPILKASSKIAARLNYLCPQFFPASGFLSNQHYNDVIPLTDASNEGSANNCESIFAENLLKFILRPYAQLGLDRLNVPLVTAYSEVVDELLSEIPEIVDAAQQVKRLWPDQADKTEGSAYRDDERHMIEEPWLAESTVPDCLESIKRDDMEIVLLGTGSSQPSKYRNVSSVFINLFSKGGLLFDCGEGTLGQLRRRYGIVVANDVVRNLKCAWVSHIHADHHAGLARVLALRRDLLNGIPHEPLLVIGPRQLKRFLDAYQRLEDLDMQFLDCRSTTEPSWNTFESDGNSQEDSCTNGKNAQNRNGPLFTSGSRMESCSRRPDSLDDHSAAYLILKRLKRLLADSGLDELISFPVVHCPQAFGIVLKAAKKVNSVGKVIPGWKVVYSGDTRPCLEVIKASRRATVLIHEATFEDNLVEEAIAKNHSTTKEAIEMGDSAGAYRIILTHFSQRYPKIPVFDETHMHNTCIAFDMMSINVADLPVLPKVIPHLKLLFKNEIVVEELDEL